MPPTKGGSVKRVSTLVVTVLATLAITAAFSAASASAATVLCGVSQNENVFCPKAQVKPAGSYLLMGGMENKLDFSLTVSGISMYNCKNNVWSFKTTKESGDPLPAETYGYTMPKTCTFFGEPYGQCSSATVGNPSATIEATGINKANVKVGSAAQPLTVSFSCATENYGQVSCTYTATGAVTLAINETKVTAQAPMKQTSSTGEPVCLTPATLNINDTAGLETFVSVVL